MNSRDLTRSKYAEFCNSRKGGQYVNRFSWGDYIAISFAWGQSTHTRRIIANGHFVTVTRNLEVALRLHYQFCPQLALGSGSMVCVSIKETLQNAAEK
jgi:hypothetical protein